MRILFLDDDPQRHERFRLNSIGHDVTHVTTFEESCIALDGGRFDQVFLDHDLSELAAMGAPADGELTGLDVARYIAAMPVASRPTFVIVHSYNRPGALRMLDVLLGAEIPATYQPFSNNTGPPRRLRDER